MKDPHIKSAENPIVNRFDNLQRAPVFKPTASARSSAAVRSGIFITNHPLEPLLHGGASKDSCLQHGSGC